MIIGYLTIPSKAVTAIAPGEDSVTYADHAVIEGKPKSQFIAENATGYSVSIYAHREFGLDPDLLHVALRQLMIDREVVALQHDDGTILGTFVITNVKPTPGFTMADGFVVSKHLDVTFKDPGLERDVVPTTSKKIAVGSNVGATADGPPEDLSTPKDSIATTTIARR